MKTILIHAWTIHQKEDKYYLPYTHWIYLSEIAKYYDAICLLSPVKRIEKTETKKELKEIAAFKNVTVYHLPHSEGYINAIRHFFAYKKAYSKLKNCDTVYARYPIPFGWLQKVYMKNARRIIHFVGDPIDTIQSNPQIGNCKKFLLTTFFLPEYWMYLWACRRASVYTNGYHIANKLEKRGIHAKAMISSTLNKEDFYFDEHKQISSTPAIIYVGYLRKAKGVETVINSFALLQQKYPDAKLTIVGSGESEVEMKQIAYDKNVQNIHFAGHIDDRQKLNDLLREHDIFCFASLSEGSPRVILEAIANGINVVSTPVGSLPYIFKDGETILFADFNDAQMFCDQMISLIHSKDKALSLRKDAFNLIQNYTIENFLKEIFHEA